MATIPLPPDFSEFLKLCDRHDVRLSELLGTDHRENDPVRGITVM